MTAEKGKRRNMTTYQEAELNEALLKELIALPELSSFIISSLK